jgi:iron complex outermembrane receptor protein
VIDLDGDYEGADLRWSFEGELAGRPVELTAGTNLDRQNQLRRGFENFVGSELGVRGNLRRDETNRIRNFDQFAQAWWQVADRWSMLAGLRHSAVKFRSIDRYIVGTNQDDSGDRKYSDTTLVGGLMYRASDALRLYASVGDGFETPTFNEISYRADGQAGLALDLNAARSDNYEAGVKWHPASGIEVEAALFRVRTDGELIVVRNSGGRSSFGNADTGREGFEASLSAPLVADLSLQASYMLVDAQFREDFLICGAPPCTTPSVPVDSGTRIPGIAKHQGALALQWAPGLWRAAVEFEARGNVTVNDSGTTRAPGYGVWHLEAGRNWELGSSTLRSFARVENVLDKTYVGSVIINEGNGRYFEAAPARTSMIGLQWSWH